MTSNGIFGRFLIYIVKIWGGGGGGAQYVAKGYQCSLMELWGGFSFSHTHTYIL